MSHHRDCGTFERFAVLAGAAGSLRSARLPRRSLRGLRVAVASLHDWTGSTGHPEVGVTLAEPDAQRFSDWTAEHVDQVIAVCVRGQVFSIAMINERLSGAFSTTLNGTEPARAEAGRAAIATNR